MAFLPLMAIPTASLNLNTVLTPSMSNSAKEERSADDIRVAHAAMIDTYFKDRSMPLAGKGMQFVLVAEKYGIDWRLLPAISVRESSGGKHDCGFNPFGWGSCKLHNFKSYDEAIETLGRHLGGASKSTAQFYAGKTTYEKLYAYNGTVVASYPDEVIAIMNSIDTSND